MIRSNNTVKFLFVFLISLCFFIQIPCTVQAVPHCSFGTCDAWMSLDGSTWMNTTIDNLSLSCGQPFFVKVTLTSLNDHVWLALFLFEPGTQTDEHTSFEVVSGPCELNSLVDLGECNKNEAYSVIWKLKVKDDPSWIGGYTPLSITACFQKMIDSDWVSDDISFSIALVHINDLLYSLPVDLLVQTNSFMDHDQNHSSGISLFFLVILFLMFILFARRFNRK